MNADLAWVDILKSLFLFSLLPSIGTLCLFPLTPEVCAAVLWPYEYQGFLPTPWNEGRGHRVFWKPTIPALRLFPERFTSAITYCTSVAYPTRCSQRRSSLQLFNFWKLIATYMNICMCIYTHTFIPWALKMKKSTKKKFLKVSLNPTIWRSKPDIFWHQLVGLLWYKLNKKLFYWKWNWIEIVTFDPEWTILLF